MGLLYVNKLWLQSRGSSFTDKEFDTSEFYARLVKHYPELTTSQFHAAFWAFCKKLKVKESQATGYLSVVDGSNAKRRIYRFSNTKQQMSDMITYVEAVTVNAAMESALNGAENARKLLF